jgi:hypothetical protein
MSLPPPASAQFDQAYYLDGIRTGKSNYENFRWLPDQTLPFARHLQWHLGLKPEDVIMEIGAARGYLVKALRMNGLNARGMDISEWAVANCDPAVKEYMSTELVTGAMIYDWVVGKDTLEHIQIDDLKALLPKLGASSRKGLFFVVPLTGYYGGAYLRVEDEADTTHKIRFTLPDWLMLFHNTLPDFNANGSYCIRGIKPAAEVVPQSCGFFTLTRR